MSPAKRYLGLGGVAIAAFAAALIFHRQPTPTARPKVAPSPLAHADALFASKPKAAAEAYESYVTAHAKSPDPVVQDHVGAARMHLGYLAAKTQDLPKARATFLAAASTKGTGAAGAFGTVSDQAAYQAAVCLVAEGKKAEAEQAFVTLLKDRPLSPLSRATYRRLSLLNGGTSKPEWDALLQAAVNKQEARGRFETSVCGPKCLERLTGESYQSIARLCGTTDDGTSIEGMRKGLKALGHDSWAYRLNRRDLAKAKLPAVMLQHDHYVVVEKIAGDDATVWDPRFGRSERWQLPSLDNPDFNVTLILLAKPEGM